MNIEAYRGRLLRDEVYQKLEAAQAQIVEGKTQDAWESLAQLRRASLPPSMREVARESRWE